MARLERIQATLPSDIKVRATRDQSRFIRKSFEEIQHHLILGGLLAALVVLLFMRNWRVTVIAGAGDPDLDHRHVRGDARARLLAQQHDDAGAVAGHRHRHRRRDRRAREHLPVHRGERARRRREAAIKATAEIGLAVMATTLSLVVIFVPVAFMTGQVGRYFYSFGITSATAIMLSMFVSFTLTPALCAWWLRPQDAHQDHATSTKQTRLLRVDGPEVRAHARVVARATAR